ncbi:U3 small nucleolar ribonucleoprotein protein IMP4 isoform X1 [Rhinatrema bivittatum]|uniref:U3 small nucleolar ribonucleoprotein protein IMP4 isoform X1 n=1 Tax=Rhinatrema bivittatum TaxID=194408 RepID=UPI00112A7318|nr:U3 small nucleolar ribonucleoprotein protein IMP4 isoform X1 [Rhinatrema bivittatum]
MSLHGVQVPVLLSHILNVITELHYSITNHCRRCFTIDCCGSRYLRREARLRREYLYKKAQEEKLRTIEEKKEKLKSALDENRLIPTEIRREALSLQKLIEFDDEGGEGVTNHVDDEYRWAGVEDPKIMITTSREPSSRLKMFAKEMKLVFPNAQRMNRGKHEMGALVQACKANNVSDLLIIHEHRGMPDGLIVCHLPFGPTAYFTLCNVVMRHDIPELGTMSEAYPHLIFHNFTSRLGQRISSILKYLFPVPKDDSKRVITFANDNDFISFRHHVYKKVDHRNIELSEVGPRFEMKLYMIKLGTLENESTAEVEWRWHPYTRTAKKRKFLSVE